MRIKKTFLQAKLNKDIDERLLPDGQYPHAENIRVATTDSSDLGAVENMEGNVQLTTYSLTDALTIGAFADSANHKLYWMVTSEEKDMVLEYDTQSELSSVLLESSRPSGVLNFSRNHLITGVVKIINENSDKDLLAWTDDYNPPRCANIARSKTYLTDGFIEDDIALIKKPPKYAPVTQLTFTTTTNENNLENKFLAFSYRYKYLDGEYSALSTFTNYQFAPKKFDLDYHTMENNGMVNAFNAVKVFFNTGSKRVKEIELVYKESNSNTIYLVERFSKEEQVWGDDEVHSFLFANSKKYIALPIDELLRSYDNVPLLAKAMEVIGNRFVFGNYVEGYDLIDVNGQNVKLDYDLSLITTELSGVPIPITVSGDRNNFSFNLSGVQLNQGNRLSFTFDLDEPTTAGTFSGDVDFILNTNYASASDLAADPDFIFFIEDILTNKFNQEFTNTPPANSSVPTLDGFTIVSAGTTTITIGSPTMTYEIDDTPADPNDDDFHTESFRWKFKATSSVFFKNVTVDSSLKTNRSYEVGLIYRDPETRATPVLTDLDNTLYIPQEFSVNQNKLKVTINHLPPAYADTYKLVVKQNKGDYHTVYTNIFYQDGIYRWVLLEGANKDKVHEGDTLIVKSDLSGAIPKIIKVRVLEVTAKPRDFLDGNKDADGNDIIEESGLYMKIKPIGFNMTFDAATSRSFSGNQGFRYPVVRCTTNPQFGQYVANTFVPWGLKSGSRVRIYIRIEAFGKISFLQEYDKRFRVQGIYASVKDWFEAEVQNLGSFGQNYLWNGINDIWDSSPPAGYGQADAFNRHSGWDFTPNGEQFWIVPFRKGTATRDIYYSVLFEVFFSEGDVIFETEAPDSDSEIYYETAQTFDIVDGKHTGNLSNQTNSTPAEIEMDFFNCYIQGNGAESYRYKDAFNTKYLNIDLRPSTTTVERYKQVRRYADLTYSEAYNEGNNINGLNEFNLAKANYKDDIDKNYGYIQKLFSRDTNLLLFQEDKVSQVFYGKDLLMNADGTSNLSAIDDILGQQTTYRGEYGISRNPESFSFDGFNIYFTDIKRGAVMRLANDGLNEISSFGMRQFFKNKFKVADDTAKIGGFDPYYDEYYIHDSNRLIGYTPPEEINP